MGTHNKRHNRKVTRNCPFCGGKVKVGNRGGLWWVYCEDSLLPNHIKQEFYGSPEKAIEEWNVRETDKADSGE